MQSHDTDTFRTILSPKPTADLAEIYAEAITGYRTAERNGNGRAGTVFANLAKAATEELRARGLRECGVCRTSAPGAVDWGCSCGKSAAELNAEAIEFARIHD